MSKQLTWAGAGCLVLGSLAALVQWLVTPVDMTLKIPEVVDRVADHHTAMGWVLALDVPLLLVIPAVLYVGRLARAGSSTFAAVATALCFVPMLGSVLLLGLDALLFEAATQSDRAAAADLVDGYVSNPFVSGTTLVYLLAHLVGFVMLAVALRRVRAVPVWACVCLAGWPFLEMGGYATGVKAVAALGYAALAVAYLACAAALVRTPASEPAEGVLV
jgi:hypothetical protein